LIGYVVIAYATKWLVYWRGADGSVPSLIHSTMVNLPYGIVGLMNPLSVRELPAPSLLPSSLHVSRSSLSSMSMMMNTPSHVVDVQANEALDIVAITSSSFGDSIKGLQKWLNWTFDASSVSAADMSILTIFIDQSKPDVPIPQKSSSPSSSNNNNNIDVHVEGTLAYAQIIPSTNCKFLSIQAISSAYDPKTGRYRLVIVHDCKSSTSDKYTAAVYVLDLAVRTTTPSSSSPSSSNNNNGDNSIIGISLVPITKGKFLYFDTDHINGRSTAAKTFHLMQHGRTIVVGGETGYVSSTSFLLTFSSYIVILIWCCCCCCC
jgi:hypothetical protein